MTSNDQTDAYLSSSPSSAYPKRIATIRQLYEGMLTTEHDPEIPLENPDRTFAYKMDHERRGIALIINNVIFLNGMPERQGSAKDARCIESVLKNLGFHVIIRHNQDSKSMKQLLEDMSIADQSNNDCFVCVILSHGDDDNVIFSTDGKVTVEELITPLLPDKCPSLTGKPKLFFIQACRGTKMDEGKEVHDAIKNIKMQVKYTKIPIWADVLISYSTVPGYYSWRNSLNGSWFIQSLCQVLKNDSHDKELMEMLTKVNYKVAYEYESKTDFPKNNRMKQAPCITSMLTKQLYFHTK